MPSTRRGDEELFGLNSGEQGGKGYADQAAVGARVVLSYESGVPRVPVRADCGMDRTLGDGRRKARMGNKF